MKKYVIISSSMHIAENLIYQFKLKRQECEFINRNNYLSIFSLNQKLIVIREFKNSRDYVNKEQYLLSKDVKYKVYKLFELLKLRDNKRINRKENKRQLKFKFEKKENLKIGDKVLFRLKETPNNRGTVNKINEKLCINNIPLDYFDEIIYGSIRIIKKEQERKYYELTETESLDIYSHLISHKGKHINDIMELLNNQKGIKNV